jgi:hypothetical protein
MNNCEHYLEQLEEHALGRPLGDSARQHVETCPDCAGTRERLRALAAAIDGSLTRLGAAEPGPSLRPRLSAALRSAGVGLSPGGRLRIAVAMAAGFAIVAAAATLQLSRPAERAQHQAATALAAASALSHWRSPTDVLLTPTLTTRTETTPSRAQGGKHAS